MTPDGYYIILFEGIIYGGLHTILMAIFCVAAAHTACVRATGLVFNPERGFGEPDASRMQQVLETEAAAVNLEGCGFLATLDITQA